MTSKKLASFLEKFGPLVYARAVCGGVRGYCQFTKREYANKCIAALQGNMVEIWPGKQIRVLAQRDIKKLEPLPLEPKQDDIMESRDIRDEMRFKKRRARSASKRRSRNRSRSFSEHRRIARKAWEDIQKQKQKELEKVEALIDGKSIDSRGSSSSGKRSKKPRKKSPHNSPKAAVPRSGRSPKSDSSSRRRRGGGRNPSRGRSPKKRRRKKSTKSSVSRSNSRDSRFPRKSPEPRRAYRSKSKSPKARRKFREKSESPPPVRYCSRSASRSKSKCAEAAPVAAPLYRSASQSPTPSPCRIPVPPPPVTKPKVLKYRSATESPTPPQGGNPLKSKSREPPKNKSLPKDNRKVKQPEALVSEPRTSKKESKKKESKKEKRELPPTSPKPLEIDDCLLPNLLKPHEIVSLLEVSDSEPATKTKEIVSILDASETESMMSQSPERKPTHKARRESESQRDEVRHESEPPQLEASKLAESEPQLEAVKTKPRKALPRVWPPEDEDEKSKEGEITTKGEPKEALPREWPPAAGDEDGKR